MLESREIPGSEKFPGISQKLKKNDYSVFYENITIHSKSSLSCLLLILHYLYLPDPVAKFYFRNQVFDENSCKYASDFIIECCNLSNISKNISVEFQEGMVEFVFQKEELLRGNSSDISLMIFWKQFFYGSLHFLKS